MKCNFFYLIELYFRITILSKYWNSRSKETIDVLNNRKEPTCRTYRLGKIEIPERTENYPRKNNKIKKHLRYVHVRKIVKRIVRKSIKRIKRFNKRL